MAINSKSSTHNQYESDTQLCKKLFYIASLCDIATPGKIREYLVESHLEERISNLSLPISLSEYSNLPKLQLKIHSVATRILNGLPVSDQDIVLKYLLGSDELENMKSTLQKIPAEDRIDCCIQMHRLLRKNLNMIEDTLIPEAKRPRLEDHITERKGLLQHIALIPKAQREEYCSYARELITKKMSIEDRILLLQYIMQYPLADRTDHFTRVQSFMTEDMNVIHMMTIADAIQKIPQEARADCCAQAHSLIHKEMQWYDRSDILTTIAKISKEERESCCAHLQSLMSRKDGVFTARNALLTQIYSIPQVEREECCICAKQLFNEEMNDTTRAELLKYIAGLSPIHRSDCSIHAERLITEDAGAIEVKLLLDIVIGIPPAERADCCAHALSLFDENLDQEDRINILEIIASLPKEDRADCCTYIQSLVKDGVDIEETANLLKILNSILPHERPLIAVYLKKYFESEIVDLKLFDCVLAMYAFPQKCWDEVADILIELSPNMAKRKRNDWTTLIQPILQKNPRLKQEMHLNLISQLQTSSNWDRTNTLAEQIFNDPERFSLSDEEDPLFIQVNQSLTFTNPKALEEEKNPFNIYEKLENMNHEQMPTVLLPKVQWGARHVTINPTVFADRATAHQTIAFTSIRQPKIALLEELFTELDQRYHDIANDSLRKEYPEYVLQRNSFANDPYLNNLLRTTAMSAENERRYFSYFSAILHDLSDQSKERNEGQLLSPYESTLLKMALCISECEAGRQEGIAMLYNQLDQKYKYALSQPAGTNSIEKAYACLHNIVQEILLGMLTSNEMMDRLTESSTGAQGVHESRYVQNAISSRVGLSGKLQFDQYTGLLTDELVAKNLHEILTIFYQYLDMNQFVNQLIETYAADTTGDLHAPFTNLLDQTPGVITPIPPDAFFQLDPEDENMEKVLLTETGAREIWIASGYFLPIE